MASSGKDLLQDALQQFQEQLHSQVLFEQGSGPGHEDNRIKEIGEAAKSEILKVLIQNIVDLKPGIINEVTVCELITQFGVETQRMIDQCLEKNHGKKRKHTSIMKKMVKSLLEDYRTSLEEKLQNKTENQDLNMKKAVLKFLEDGKLLAVKYFEHHHHWTHGNSEEVFLEEKKKLIGRLEEIGMEVMLNWNIEEEEEEAEVEMITAPVTVPVVGREDDESSEGSCVSFGVMTSTSFQSLKTNESILMERKGQIDTVTVTAPESEVSDSASALDDIQAIHENYNEDGSGSGLTVSSKNEDVESSSNHVVRMNTVTCGSSFIEDEDSEDSDSLASFVSRLNEPSQSIVQSNLGGPSRTKLNQTRTGSGAESNDSSLQLRSSRCRDLEGASMEPEDEHIPEIFEFDEFECEPVPNSRAALMPSPGLSFSMASEDRIASQGQRSPRNLNEKVKVITGTGSGFGCFTSSSSGSGMVTATPSSSFSRDEDECTERHRVRVSHRRTAKRPEAWRKRYNTARAKSDVIEPGWGVPAPAPSAISRRIERRQRFQNLNEDEIFEMSEGTSTSKTKRTRGTPEVHRAPVTFKRPQKQILKKTPTLASDEECPLIFRLTDDAISVTSRIHCIFEFGNLSVAPFMGIDDNSLLICGMKAKSCREFWSVCQSNFADLPETIAFKVGIGSDQMIKIKLTPEFLYGYLLKTLKNSAEQKFGKKFKSGVVIVPSWLPSTQRLLVKNAAMICGFAEVHLINQESLTAFIYCSNQRNETDVVVIVLLESFGTISGTLYHWRNSNGTLRMINNDSIRTSQKRKETAMKLCQNLLFHTDHDLDLDFDIDAIPKGVIFLAKSPEWFGVFQEVGELLEDEYNASVVVPRSSDFFGDFILTRRKLDGVIASMEEYLVSGIVTDGPSRFKNIVISAKTRLPTQNSCEISLQPFSKSGILDFYSRGKNNPVGQIEFLGFSDYVDVNGCFIRNSKVFTDYKLDLAFEISKEAIVSLKQMQVKYVGEQEKEEEQEVAVDDFIWRSPNADEETREAIKELIHAIFEAERMGGTVNVGNNCVVLKRLKCK